MLSITDFILLKSIFCEDLHKAVMKEDKEWVTRIILSHYTMECYEGFIEGVHGVYSDETYKKLNSIDIKAIKQEHERAIREDDFSWAL